MSEIFNEMNMRQALEKYIPNGEMLLAGIHALAKEIEVKGVFGGCICTDDWLLPDQNGKIVTLSKKKYSTYDIYLGITPSFLVMADCETSSYLYQFDDGTESKEEDIQQVTSAIFLSDIGKCFPLADIQSCVFKKGWMGSIKCSMQMKNKSHFKLILPKLGGLGNGMPHHTEYRDAIILRLQENSK